MNKKPVYFITCVEVQSRESIVKRNEIHAKGDSLSRWNPDYDLGRVNKRTWGFVHDLEEAKEMVENNYTDLHETIYTWVFIEGISPSFPVFETTAQWIYEWEGDRDEGGYKQIDEWPKELAKIYERIAKVMASVG